jgi:hypothetical protein
MGVVVGLVEDVGRMWFPLAPDGCLVVREAHHRYIVYHERTIHAFFRVSLFSLHHTVCVFFSRFLREIVTMILILINMLNLEMFIHSKGNCKTVLDQ